MFGVLDDVTKKAGVLGVFLALTMVLCTAAGAQAPLNPPSYTFKPYFVNSLAYPVVQVYCRTFDQDRNPLVNVGLQNLLVQVDGRNYDPQKNLVNIQAGQYQYNMHTLEQRQEGFRIVFVWDCSKSMAGQPFMDAKAAITKFIQIKRPKDQVAIIAVRDEQQGYEVISSFESDATRLYQRMDDVDCDGMTTRLYDAIAAATEMCATTSQPGINSQAGEYVVVSGIVVVSDGHDEGSAVPKEVLMNRLGELKPPIPVFSIAYSNTNERQYFGNLEGISKATFGTYWTVAESREFSPLVEKIHKIHLSDYVICFRSYVPVDGQLHNFALMLTYPAGSSNMLPGKGQFMAADSPMPFHAQSAEVYKKLMAQYPEIPGGPWVGPSPAAGSGVGDGGMSENLMPPVPPSDGEGGEGGGGLTDGDGDTFAQDPPPADNDVAADTEEAEETPFYLDRNNLMLGGVGAAILVLLVVIIAWVKSSASASRASAAASSSTNPAGRSTNP